MRAWLAQTHGDLAGMLLERGEPGDARRALEHAGDALEASRSMGIARLAAEAAALQRRAGAAPAGATQALRTFTAR